MFKVLIPNYNNSKYLEECLNSVLSQITNFEYHIYINDDCSKDNSIQIINEYIIKYPGKITLFQNNIPHYTTKHMGKKPRISIAFDIIVDEKAKLPMFGTIGSLNVSVACGAFLYEAVRQRQ